MRHINRVLKCSVAEKTVRTPETFRARADMRWVDLRKRERGGLFGSNLCVY